MKNEANTFIHIFVLFFLDMFFNKLITYFQINTESFLIEIDADIAAQLKQTQSEMHFHHTHNDHHFDKFQFASRLMFFSLFFRLGGRGGVRGGC